MTLLHVAILVLNAIYLRIAFETDFVEFLNDVQAPPKSRTVRVLLHLGLTVLLHYQHACFLV